MTAAQGANATTADGANTAAAPCYGRRQRAGAGPRRRCGRQRTQMQARASAALAVAQMQASAPYAGLAQGYATDLGRVNLTAAFEKPPQGPALGEGRR